MNRRERAKAVINQLEKMYPDAACSLYYEDPIQLMVATQLAAQCTDARVNIVTKDLFKKYKTVYDFANADLSELEQDIRSTGFYRNKAKNIIGSCRMIISKFVGTVHTEMDSLLKLPELEGRLRIFAE